MTTSSQGSELEIKVILEKVFRIIHEGVILHEYLSDKEYATLSVTLKNITPPLRGLRISQCLEKPLSTYALTQLLQDNTTLEWFYLEANLIDATGIKAISEILKQNGKLQQLHIGFLFKGIDVEELQALSDMLLVNTTLKELSLYADGIDADKTKIIADTLAKNPALEKLNLASNEIGHEGATALADALTKNTKLLELNVSDCRLGSQGIKTIFSALKQNTALRTLTFRRLNADAIPALSEMLTANKALKKLDISLYTSEFSVEQIQQLLQALRQNTSLQELDIQDDDGKLKAEIKEIKEILAKNMGPAAAAAPKEGEAPADAKQEGAQQPKSDAADKKETTEKSTA